MSPTQEANSPDQNSTKKKNRTKPAKGETNGRVSISAGDSGKPAKQKKFNKSESQDSNEQPGTPKIRTRPSHQTNTSEDDVPRGKSAGELSRTKQSIESEGDEVPKKSSSMKTTGSKSGQLSVSSTSSGNTTSFKKKSNSKKVPKKQSKEQLGDSREDEENKSSPKSDNSGSNGVINKKKSKLNISSSKDKDKDYDNNNNNNNTHRGNYSKH